MTLASAPEARAATFTVNAWNDATSDGSCDMPWTSNATDCTLRDAVDAANANPGDDIIEFDPVLAFFDGSIPGIVTSTQAQLLATVAPEDANADGDADLWDDMAGTTLTIRGGSIRLVAAGNTDRVLHVPAPPAGKHEVHLILEGLSIDGGRIDLNAHLQPEGGGCVAVRSTDLTLISSELTGCVVDASTLPYSAGTPGGGSVYAGGDLEVIVSKISQGESRNRDGGAIDARGQVSLQTVELFDNHVRNNGVGGGLVVMGGTQDVTIESKSHFLGNTAPLGGGGAWLEPVSLRILDSEFEDNASVRGGGVYLVPFDPGLGAPPMVERSTFLDNNANDGGGMYIEGPPINGWAPLVFHNSTFSRNRYCGPGCAGGGLYLQATLAPLSVELEHVTMVENVAAGATPGTVQGDPLHNAGSHSVTFTNSIIEGQCTGTAAGSGGGNFVFNVGDCGTSGPLDVAPAGPTNFVFGSGAFPWYVDSIAYIPPSFTRVHDVLTTAPLPRPHDNPNCVAGVASDDQRAAPRPAGAHCDSGAVER